MTETLSPALRQLLVNLAHVVTPTFRGQPGEPRPQSHNLGSDHVAIVLVATLLAERRDCVTAATVGPYAGASRSTVAKKLASLTTRKWVELVSEHCPAGVCASRTKHYRPTA